LTYQLHYDYDETATAPLFKKFLDRILPDVAVQKLLFQYIAYIFLRNMNLEKLLFLYGGGANGKSVFLNVIRGLVGEEQCCEYSLEGITGSEYQRAELGNYLLNVSSEISTRMGKDIFKKLASREPLQARHPYGRPFTVKDYATSIFAMNELPKDVEQTGAFCRRFLIVTFDVWIPDDEQEQDLARRIIDSEMSGVLNYLIEGVKSLLAAGKFEIPATVQTTVDKFRQDSDTVLVFLDENGYRPCVEPWKPLREMYKSYREQCLDGGHRPASKTTFAQRLRSRGYTVIKNGKSHQTVVYATQESEDSDNVYGEGTMSGDDKAASEVYTANYDAHKDRRARRNYTESW
jgi:putative DNA primase/helicase